eukprot:NODE_453_length_1730_cov_8.863177_g378_i0.p1 GENE.NODE_453_length_1730_cov_8.863177_g378_i0~~NODE_453_length_1730_cov_8.863177_g378_i0.p1  ORF type:complete len:309 (+),score=46.28 NODE_453_length_1730_cov_8.863177_g378_i0:742-1668(+)
MPDARMRVLTERTIHRLTKSIAPTALPPGCRSENFRRWKSSTFDHNDVFREVSPRPCPKKVDPEALVRRLYPEPVPAKPEFSPRPPCAAGQARQQARCARRMYYDELSRREAARAVEECASSRTSRLAGSGGASMGWVRVWLEGMVSPRKRAGASALPCPRCRLCRLCFCGGRTFYATAMPPAKRNQKKRHCLQPDSLEASVRRLHFAPCAPEQGCARVPRPRPTAQQQRCSVQRLSDQEVEKRGLTLVRLEKEYLFQMQRHTQSEEKWDEVANRLHSNSGQAKADDHVPAFPTATNSSPSLKKLELP